MFATNNHNKHEFNFNIDLLSKGVYLLRVNTEDGIHNQRLIKQ